MKVGAREVALCEQFAGVVRAGGQSKQHASPRQLPAYPGTTYQAPPLLPGLPRLPEWLSLWLRVGGPCFTGETGAGSVELCASTLQPSSMGCLCPVIHWRPGSQGCAPGWPAFPSSQSTHVLACVNMSRGMSVHGHEWVWMHVGARG